MINKEVMANGHFGTFQKSGHYGHYEGEEILRLFPIPSKLSWP
jgi:hypothetical protein